VKKYQEAREDLKKAVALDPYQSEFWFAKAQVYYHSGDYLAARLDCEEALRLDPESKEYESFMQLLQEKSKL
jgi:tetratricopeptide (TPR) repeat protein